MYGKVFFKTIPVRVPLTPNQYRTGTVVPVNSISDPYLLYTVSDPALNVST